MSAAVIWETYLSGTQAPAPADIAAAEARLGASYPEDIKPYFMTQAGRTTNPESIEIGKRVAPFGPLVLFINDPADPNFSYSLSSALEAMIEWGGNKQGQPIRFLPIADDTENGFFCYDLSVSKTAPPIVYIDTEFDVGDKRSVSVVSPTFTTFLEKLK